jgi:hypothetical protein
MGMLRGTHAGDAATAPTQRPGGTFRLVAGQAGWLATFRNLAQPDALYQQAIFISFMGL